MIIGVDAGALSITDERLRVGVWRVTFHLLQELSSLDRHNSYRLYSFRPVDREVMQHFGSNMQNVVLTPTIGWSSVRLPLELKIHPVDVFLGLAQTLPSSLSNTIGFVYDVGFLFHSDAYGASAKKLAKQTKQLVERANHIVTISESSKQDILNRYPIPEKQVTVAYPGVSFLASQGVAFKGSPYFLFVGSLNKAKDVPLAITAFASFLKKVKRPYDFVLVGGEYWPDPAIDALIHQYKLEQHVHKVGHISDDALVAYYRGATALVATGLREGFCLPAAEAMAVGTPVVAVDRGSLKEVIGDGGIIVDKPSAQALAEAMLGMMDEKFRAKVSKSALQQASRYSWKTFAKTVYNTYAYLEERFSP